MKELHEEGVANHLGPESCGFGREAALEALTGEVWAGALSRENCLVLGADALLCSGRQHRVCRYARQARTWRGRRPHARMETSRAEVGRSRGWPWEDAPRVRVRNHRVSVR